MTRLPLLPALPPLSAPAQDAGKACTATKATDRPGPGPKGDHTRARAVRPIAAMTAFHASFTE